MTTPAVPDVRNIRDLRRLWPKWYFSERPGYPWEIHASLEIIGSGQGELLAARALAVRLAQAGYEAKP